MGRFEVNLPNLRRVGKNYYFRRKVGGKTFNHRLPDPLDPTFREAYDRFATPDGAVAQIGVWGIHQGNPG